MSAIVDRYAYPAEAGLAHFSDAHQMRHELNGRERLACSLFGRAARSSLLALCASQNLPADAATVNLMAPVSALQRRTRILGRHAEKAEGYARLLTRVLILDQHDAGAGYVTRDLFQEDDVAACEEAAQYFVDLSCRHLLRCTWEQALIRFMPFREPPMTDTVLWQRRGNPVHRPSSRS